MSAQNKQEKRIMDEKIAKVREVVRNISANDIVLALHNFELDVERTIQAFCEGGHENALGDWEQTGGVAKKQKKKSKKPSANIPVPATNEAPVGTKPVHNTSSFAETNIAASAHFAAPKVALAGVSNHFGRNEGANVPQLPKISTGSNKKTPLANVYSSTNTQKLGQTGTYSASAVKQKALTAGKSLDGEESSLIQLNGTDALIQYSSELRKMENDFDAEIIQSEANLSKCFQELRCSLEERERQLRKEMLQVRKEGHAHFFDRQKKLQGLIAESDELENVKRASLVNNIHSFNNEKNEDQKLAYLNRFLYDNSSSIKEISCVGQVVHLQYTRSSPSERNNSPIGVSPLSIDYNGSVNVNNHSTARGNAETCVKHSTSHSSLVSSVGEDSGLGQISPVHREKNMAQVQNGGISMQSDALSADQLTDFQKQVDEILRAKGIDPAVLTDLGMNTVAPRRRQPFQKNGGGGNSVNGNGKLAAENGGGPTSGKSGQRNGGGKKPQNQQQPNTKIAVHH